MSSWPYRFNSVRALGFLLMTLTIFLMLYFMFNYLIARDDLKGLEGLLDLIFFVGFTLIFVGCALASIEKK